VEVSTTSGDDEQQEHVADDEGGNKEGEMVTVRQSDGYSDMGGEQATAMRVMSNEEAMGGKNYHNGNKEGNGMEEGNDNNVDNEGDDNGNSVGGKIDGDSD
jgi:hypothetical protein